MKKILLILATVIYIITVPIFLFYDQINENTQKNTKLLTINDVYISFKGAKYLIKAYNQSSTDVYNINVDTIYLNGKYEQTKFKIYYENNYINKTLYTLSELIEYNSLFSILTLIVFFMYIQYKILFINSSNQTLIIQLIYYLLIYVQIISMLIIHFYKREIHIYSLTLLIVSTILNEIFIMLYIEDSEDSQTQNLLIKKLTKIFLLIMIVMCFVVFMVYNNDFKCLFEYLGFLFILIIGVFDEND